MERYNEGLITATASAALLAAICVRITSSAFWTRTYQSNHIATDASQFLAALSSTVSCLCLPRRPVVLNQNLIVDGQYTVSAFSSYTFGFASNVLSCARTKASLELNDLPRLHLEGRSSYLLQYFSTVTKDNDRLWTSILKAHWFEFIFQIVWAVLQSALAFVPQFVMYQLLRLLEQRSEGASIENKAWGLVIGLGGSITIASWAQAWAYWICWARLGQPIRAELSALIFNKSLRRKDVKGVEEAKASKPAEVATPEINTNSAPFATQTDALPESQLSLSGTTENNDDDEDDENAPKSRQSTINLVVSNLVASTCVNRWGQWVIGPKQTYPSFNQSGLAGPITSYIIY